ncbi:hypothetical protein OIU74_017923 [Salix koriyanagi]|uniref:Uncharacterized protein n=1 Tax=Salix koriyanagi TaxID=2511006 RepID=A0A9Q0WT13_9ROSI|nr:hypothetical protein OIU74_017923 [Salix koriyanagi]
MPQIIPLRLNSSKRNPPKPMQLHGQNGTVFRFFTSPQLTTDTGNDTAIIKGLDGEEIVADVAAVVVVSHSSSK